MQRPAKITEPDYGALMEDMFYEGGGNSYRPLHPAAPGMRARLRHRQASEGPELHDLRRAERDGLRGAAAEIVDGRAHRIDPETDKPRACWTVSPTTRATPR